MADQTSAASLPGGSVVVDDLKGMAFYAVGDPGEDDRWVETTAERSDLAVDYALRHGGEVVRVGDDTPGAAPVIRNEDLTAPERAALDAWMRGSADTTGMLYAVRHALAAAGPTLAPDARERLARHLYLADCGDDQDHVAYWNAPNSVNIRRRYEARADRILAVITGQEN